MKPDEVKFAIDVYLNKELQILETDRKDLNTYIANCFTNFHKYKTNVFI